MSRDMYELIFEGKLVEGIAIDDAKANMARLFKATPAQIDRMFTGQRVVLRHQLDEDNALKYQVALKKNGVLTELVKMADASAPTAAPAPAAPTPPVSASSVPPAPAKATYGAASPSARPAAGLEGERLSLAGERADEVLKGVDWSIAPVGVRMEDEKIVATPIFEHLDDISIAPVGVRMSDEKKTPPPPPPDTSHLSIKKD